MTVSPSKRRMSTSIARLIAVAALSMGGLALAGTAGAQDSAECGTYGPACPTGSGSGSGGADSPDASGTGGPDSGALPDSAGNDAGNPPSQAEPPSSPNDSPINAPSGGPAPTAVVVNPTAGAPAAPAAPATPAAAANPVTVGGVAQTPVAGELGRTGTSASTIAIVAAAVVLLGSALVLGARRRNQG